MSEIVLPDDPGFGPEVQVDYPGYRSTRLRAPKRPLVTLPEELHPPDGPVFGEDAIGELDGDLTRQHAGEPLGERIVVSGRVLDESGRPIRGALVEVWQANAGGRYRHEVDQHPAPLDPNFSGGGRVRTDDAGSYRFVTIKPGAYPWGNHENAWRPAHIHFSVFGRAFSQRLVTQMYFPGDPAVRLRPDLPFRPRPEGPRAADLAVRSRVDDAGVGTRPTAGTSCSAAAEPARRLWRSRHPDADPIADGRAVLHDRALPRARARARSARRPVGDRAARRARRRRRRRRSRTG